MIDDKLWEKLNDEVDKLRKEYAQLKNKPEPFETEKEEVTREIRLRKDKDEKSEVFRSLGSDFEKKRNFVLELRKKVEILKLRQRKDELEQKLKDQTISERDLLELQVLNSYYTSEA